ncbi:Alpha/Beta hydrolase protein, partial [Suillus discolor]
SSTSISWDVVQEEIPAVDFVNKYSGLFSFNQTYTDYLNEKAATYNYTGYMDKYVTYPPTGLLPLPGDSIEFAEGCDVWDDIFYNALVINVKEAIHAPVETQWSECSNINVFPNGDNSLPPVFTVLPNVIEKNQRTVIVHGLADFILIADGTRIVIQKSVRNGLQGFQTPIANDSFIVDGVGAYGTTHSERGLTYYEGALSGHMIPQFAPVAAFQIMQYLMGFRDTP